ncbi:MAG: hypothetical protein R3A47_10125 [Polyangiales bacterium]
MTTLGRWTITAVLLVLPFASGCAKPSSAKSANEAEDSVFTDEVLRKYAADYYARHLLAKNEAQALRDAGQDGAALDKETEARIWIEAASTEAARIDFERRAKKQISLANEAEKEADHFQAKRLALEENLSRQKSVQLANEQAALAMQRSSSAGERWTKEEQKVVVQYLFDRALLDLSAAVSLGADRENATALMNEVRTARRSDATIVRAESLLMAAENLLGSVRQADPSRGQSLQLSRRAKEFGLQADTDEFGTMVWVRHSTKNGRWSRDVSKLGSIARAFPSGALSCALFGTAAQSNLPLQHALREELLSLMNSSERSNEREVALDFLDSTPTSENVLRCTFASYRGSPVD